MVPTLVPPGQGMTMEVNITKRIVTKDWDRYCSVVLNSNGRVRADWVIVDGKQEKHPEGAYYLEWREDGKRKRQSVGNDATVAFNSRLRKLSELEARAQGLEVRVPKSDNRNAELRVAIADFLAEIKLARTEKTWRGYRIALTNFQQCCTKKRAEDLERIDLLRFPAFLREKKKLAPRTVCNQFACLITFLDSQGVPRLVSKRDRPRFVKTKPEIYEDDQLRGLYRVCSLYHQTLYDFLLMTGFREQEAMYVTWEDIHFSAKTVSVKWKAQYDWMPKGYKEREVPVPAELLQTLEEYRKTLPEKRRAPGALVFSTRSGKPDTHMIRALKRNACRANLNPDRFWLHKFRATFATSHLRTGADVETVMSWMGQTEMESILRYLVPARHHETRHIVDKTFTGPTFVDRRKTDVQVAA